MATWTTPVTDYASPDGVAYSDLNEIGGDLQHLKEQFVFAGSDGGDNFIGINAGADRTFGFGAVIVPTGYKLYLRNIKVGINFYPTTSVESFLWAQDHLGVSAQWDSGTLQSFGSGAGCDVSPNTLLVNTAASDLRTNLRFGVTNVTGSKIYVSTTLTWSALLAVTQ